MQKSEKFIWYLLTTALFVCNVFAFINLYKKDRLISICTDNWQKSQNKNITLINNFIEWERKCVESENFPLSDQLILKDLEGNSYLLKEKLNQSPILFFRFSGTNCETCIDLEIQRMTQYLSDVKHDKVVILASDKNVDELSYFKKINGIKFEIFLVEKEDIRIPLEQYNIPYLFTLSPDGFTNTVFIPERNESKFSEQYYNLIRKLL